MSFREVDVFFQMRSWYHHSHALLEKGMADLELIKMPTNEVMHQPNCQFIFIAP
jgi:hypothetical protein